ncbi:MAG: hypothetical protein KY455_05455 [Euryarchaeota archaeon]|nr:hypothetical protein [Euryarchaeota archaeon]
MRIGLALVLLLLITGLSSTPVAAAPTTTFSAAEHDLRWLLPDVAYVGHPLHAAYAIVADKEPLRLVPHVDVPVSIFLDDTLLFRSTSVHEHDGFHGIKLTAPGEGILRFVAGGTGDGHDHGDGGAGAVVVGEVPVIAGNTSGYERMRLSMEGISFTYDEVDGVYDSRSAVRLHHANLAWTFDVRDTSGRLVVAYDGIHPRGEPFFSVTHPEGMTLRSYFGPNPFDDRSYPGVLIDGPEAPAVEHPPVGGSVWPTAVSPCSEPFVTDPDSLVDGRLVWQEATDIRVARVDLDAPAERFPSVSYRIWDGDMLRVPGSATFGIWGTDPFSQIAFAAPGPGRWVLFGDNCDLEFEILPNPEARGKQGVLATSLQTGGGNATVTFTPVHPETAEPIPHYEFDTRVFQVNPEARLVWKAKLHGHAGPASFSLHGLPAGDYEVHTYPSPQDRDAVPLATDDPRGFVTTFHVNGGKNATAHLDSDSDVVTLPSVDGLLTTLALTLVFGVLRRRP